MPLPHLLAPSPEAAGVSSTAVAALFASAEQHVVDGTLGACSLAVARHGRLAAAAAFGRDPSSAPVTDRSLFHLYSSTKAIVAAACWKLVDQGLLCPDTAVADYFPEFGSSERKRRVTLLHALTFTAGLPAQDGTAGGPAGMLGRYGSMATAAGRAAHFGRLELECEPGSKYEYDRDAPWIVAECIERVRSWTSPTPTHHHSIQPVPQPHPP
eukprot:SAG22_NODE_2882_length_2126_cov_2.271337_1_plen_212_part_00